jgi:hypothetical protein
MRIRRMTAPPDVREIDEKIAEVRLRKESSIDSQDFEGAARLRDEERQLARRRDAASASGSPARWTSSPRSTRRRSPRSSPSGPASRLQAHRGGDGEAPPHGGRAPQAHRRPVRGRRRGVEVDPQDAGRAEGPQAALRLVHLPRPSGVGRPSSPRRSRSSCSATRTR